MELPPTYVEGFHDLESVKKMRYHTLGRTGMKVCERGQQRPGAMEA
jgi:hypothetical protein